MPKNKFGGNKAKKGKNYISEKDFIVKEPDQEYAKVVKVLGSCNFELMCEDGATRMGHARGKMRKKIWINENDTVLVGLRDFQDNKCDIIHKYSEDEVKRLNNINEVKSEVVKQEVCSFEFDEI